MGLEAGTPAFCAPEQPCHLRLLLLPQQEEGLKVWAPDQLHWHLLGTCYQGQFSGSPQTHRVRHPEVSLCLFEPPSK